MNKNYSLSLILHIPTLAWRLGLMSQYYTYLEISRTFQLLKKRAELASLIAWANRKHVKVGIRRHYEGMSQTIIEKLQDKKRWLGWKFIVVEIIYYLNDSIMPPQRYSKGFAKKYKNG